MSQGEQPSQNDRDAKSLSALLAQRVREAAGGASASDIELAIAAEGGIAAIPEADRERVLNAIAANTDGAMASVALHAALHEEARESPIPIDAHREAKAPPRFAVLYRFSQAGLAAAAAVAIVSAVQLATFAPTPTTGDPGNVSRPMSIDIAPTPTEDPGALSDADSARRRAIQSRLAWGSAGVLGMLGIIVLTPRGRRAGAAGGAAGPWPRGGRRWGSAIRVLLRAARRRGRRLPLRHRCWRRSR